MNNHTETRKICPVMTAGGRGKEVVRPCRSDCAWYEPYEGKCAMISDNYFSHITDHDIQEGTDK